MKPTHDAWGCKIWQPADEPYRVLGVYQSSQAGCFGWASGKPQTFATLEAARDAASKIGRRGLIELNIHVAENAETWAKNGKWKLVEKVVSRRRKATA